MINRQLRQRRNVVATLLNLQIGTLTVSVGSFHVYESRYEMFKAILEKNNFVGIGDDRPPSISRFEAHNLIEKSINPTFGFSQWLTNL